MKKIFVLTISALTVLFACSKQEEISTEDQITPNLEGPVSEEPSTHDADVQMREITIKTSTATKATWVDGEGFMWNPAEDATSFGLFCNVADAVQQSTAMSIQDDGNGNKTSQFTVSVPMTATKAFIMYPYGHGQYNQSANPTNAGFWYGIQSDQTQTSAGTMQTMNNRALLVTPVAIDINGSQTEYVANFEMVSSVLRFLIFDEANNGATVSSVTLTPKVENFFKPQFTTNYTFDSNALNTYVDYSVVRANSFRVSLTNAYSVGSSKPTDAGAGIYLSLPACEIEGYTITVTTNLGDFSFSTDSGVLPVNQGSIRNIYLNLDKATSKPAMLGKTYVLKYPRFAEVFQVDLPSYTSRDWTDHTYYHANISENGGISWSEPSADQTEWYSPDWTYEDSNGDAVSWLSYRYRENASWLQYRVEQNPDPTPRIAYAIATFHNVEHAGEIYYMDPSEMVKRIKVIQPANPYAPTIVSITPSPIYFSSSDSDAKTVTVTTTNATGITVTNPTGDYSFFDVSTPTGSSNTFTFTITPSSAGADARTASYTVTATDGDPSTTDPTFVLNINQAAAGAAGLTYIFETDYHGPAPESMWGITYSQTMTGARYIDIKNISRVDGNAIDMETEREAIIAEAILITGSDSTPLDPSILRPIYSFMDGSIICCSFATGTSAYSGARVTWYNSNGVSRTENSYWIINIPS